MKKFFAALSALTLALIALVSVLATPAQAAPTDCTGPVFCAYQNVAPPYGSKFTASAGSPRNTCIEVGSPKAYQYNNTGLVWRGFRGSDPTCQGAHIALPPWSHGAVVSWGSGWSTIGAVSRTSSTG